MPLIGALLLAINVALIVHTVNTGRFWPWAYVILMLPGAGAIAYVVVELVPELLGTHKAQTARRRIGAPHQHAPHRDREAQHRAEHQK